MVLLPLVIAIAGGVLIFPFTPILLFAKPGLESLFVVLLLLGQWPMGVAILHSGFIIEHFIGRSLPKGAAEKYDMFRGGHFSMYLRLSVGAGDFLSRALNDYGKTLDEEAILRGKKLVYRHRAIA